MYLNRGLIFPMQKGDVCCLARCSSYLCEVQETEDSQIIVNCIDKSVWDGNKRASSPVLFSSRTRLLYGIHTCVCNHLCGISVVVELRDKKQKRRYMLSPETQKGFKNIVPTVAGLANLSMWCRYAIFYHCTVIHCLHLIVLFRH